jgi:tryptophanyl-tRNA synthetase
MPRIFSGVQPTGELHIGNLLGAVQNWVTLQDTYECLYCIVDLHAITGSFYEPASHAQRTREMALGLLASGIDPVRATLFVQSHVPEHSELQWLLNAVTPLGELERMTQFKDKSAHLESIRADLIPVGEDQVQHLELTREICRRWNAAYAGGRPLIPEPQPLLTAAKRIMGLDGDTKMSKSKGNTIGILDAPAEIWAKLRPAKTDPARVTKKDPGTPEICNIYALHGHFSPPETVALVAENCRGAKWGCLDCKRVLADNMSASLAPIRERAAALEAEPGRVGDALSDGARKAGAIARETIEVFRDGMGFLPAKAL